MRAIVETLIPATQLVRKGVIDRGLNREPAKDLNGGRGAARDQNGGKGQPGIKIGGSQFFKQMSYELNDKKYQNTNNDKLQGNQC